MSQTRVSGSGGILSHALSQRVREHSDAVLPLVLEAFREGRRVGAASMADELLHHVIEQLATAERQYEALGAEQMESIIRAHEGGDRPPVVVAYFGATGSVLIALRDEIRRIRLGRNGRAGEG